MLLFYYTIERQWIFTQQARILRKDSQLLDSWATDRLLHALPSGPSWITSTTQTPFAAIRTHGRPLFFAYLFGICGDLSQYGPVFQRFKGPTYYAATTKGIDSITSLRRRETRSGTCGSHYHEGYKQYDRWSVTFESLVHSAGDRSLTSNGKTIR